MTGGVEEVPIGLVADRTTGQGKTSEAVTEGARLTKVRSRVQKVGCRVIAH